VIVHGHSHRPGAALEGGLLFVNPGSAGPRRFSLPRAAGLLTVEGRSVEVRLFDLATPRLASLGAPLRAEL
jgi:predicted phosphodiesterase